MARTNNKDVEATVTDDSAQAEALSPRQPERQEPCADQPLAARIEALLMTSDRPMTELRLGELLGIAGKGAAKQVAAAIDELNAAYQQSNRTFRAERLAGGWQILTLPAFGPLLHRLHDDRQQSRLSQPAMETLSIIAYRQPIMRAEIEAIRGVASGEVLRGLLERRMVKIVGRAEELGRPMLYGTTAEFLKVFGLASLDDLPQVKGLAPTNTAAKAKPATAKKAHVEAQSDEQDPEINVNTSVKAQEANANNDD